MLLPQSGALYWLRLITKLSDGLDDGVTYELPFNICSHIDICIIAAGTWTRG